jgi:rhamnulokinase
MTEPRSFIAVDLGAQSGRVVLGTFTPDGLTLDEVHRFANEPVTVAGTLCWDTDELFEQTLIGIARAVGEVAAQGRHIEGISVDSWGVDYGLVDAVGALVAPVRHYRASDPSLLTIAHERVSAAEAFARTGVTEMAINTCFQLLRDAQAGLLAGSPTMLLTPDLWTFWLTGSIGAEATIASTTGLLDQRSGNWAHDLADRLGIALAVLPAIADPGSPAGVTLPAINERLRTHDPRAGSHGPIPVFRGASHDTASAFAAVADPGEGVAVISCGTWALVGCSTTTPVLTGDAMAAGFTNEQSAGGATLFVRNLSGTWLLEECLRAWVEADAGVQTVPELRAALLGAASAASGPDLAGTIDPGDASLIEAGDMPGRIADLYRRTCNDSQVLGRVDLVRLILSSLAHSFDRSIREASRLTGQSLTEIRMIGGGSQILPLVALTRQATGLSVATGPAEATSIGNLCIQGVAAGVFETLGQARLAARRLDPS